MSSTMAMIAVAVCFAVSCWTAVAATGAVTTTVQPSDADEEQRIKSNVTVVAARLLEEYITPTVCTYAPDYCTKHELHSSRGIQSYLATAGTLFAGVLGIMFTKIKILVIVSLMTMIIGKMLLFYAYLKSDLHHHKPYYHVPFVKYTKDKYYIKHHAPPTDHHGSDVYVESEPSTHHSPYHAHGSGGVSYYRR